MCFQDTKYAFVETRSNEVVIFQEQILNNFVKLFIFPHSKYFIVGYHKRYDIKRSECVAEVLLYGQATLFLPVGKS